MTGPHPHGLAGPARLPGEPGAGPRLVVRSYGDCGLLAEVAAVDAPVADDSQTDTRARGPVATSADGQSVLRLYQALRASAAPVGVLDVVPAEATLLVTVDRPDRLAAAREWLERTATPAPREQAPTDPGALPAEPGADAPVGIQTVRVRYDGPDLTEVARLTGLTVDAVIAAHTAGTWTSAFCGFSPGFAYLVGGDPALRVPRRSDPRTRVPAGAVALAGHYCGIYPRSSPGGWQLIGSTELTLWDVDADPPARLAPGTRVRFEAIR